MFEEDRSGQTLKGYALRERIGEGGFGAVYRAYQSVVDRDVVVKTILPMYANQADFIRRFEAEARMIARLEHPHIVPLYDYWRDPDGAYLVMRWFRGGNLLDRLDAGPLDLELTAKLLDQITGALAAAHYRDVVHHDIKPANILLDEAENFYLTDFGVATLIDSEEDEDIITGSLAYMAPEKLRKKPFTTRSDVYSLGITLYEILTGRHPFGELTVHEMISRQVSTALPELQQVRADLSPALNHIIQTATHKDPARRYDDVREMARAFRQAIADGSPLTPSRDVIYLMPQTNPYKGLRAFDEADADDFFGRDALVNQLLNRLQEPTPNHRFLAVVGPSGSGKSSVIKAGLLPRLVRGALPGSENWFVVKMVPGEQPIQNLEAALLSVAPTPLPDLGATLRTDSTCLQRFANEMATQSGVDSDVLIVIDQFEELFTLTDDDAQITHFLDLLRRAVMAEDSRLWVIIALRADFYDRPLLYENFAALMQSRTQAVIPLTTIELEEAIVRPAQRVGMQVEADLVTQIVADVREEPGALPLLQYALSEVFERCENRQLTLAVYRASGGVLGALARRAEEVYLGLDSSGQAVARQVFLRLVTLGEGMEDTRRRARHSELDSVVANGADMQRVFDVFGQYRLLTFDRDRDTREPTIEVAHEALIRTWTRLREWLGASRDDIRLQRLLAAAASEWVENHQKDGFLLHGGRLAQFAEWGQVTDLALTRQEREFLAASVAEQQRQEKEEITRQAYERELERRSRQRLQIALIILLVASAVGILLTLAIFNQSQVAQNARMTSDANAVIADREADVSRSLALANGAEALLRGDEPHPDVALALAIEAINIAEPPAEASLSLVNAASLSQIRQRYLERVNVQGVAVSPDGQIALAALVDGTVTVRDLASGEVLRQLTGHTDSVTSVAFSPDGHTAATGSSDQTVALWNVDTGERLRLFEGHSGPVNRVIFSPDGQTLFSASNDQTVIQWDGESGAMIRQFTGHADAVFDVAVSPDGQTILTASNDQTAILWDTATGEIRHQFEGFPRPVRAAAYHPDGTTAVLATDTDLFLVDLTTFETRQTLVGHNSAMTRVAFSPDGHRILSSTDSVELFLWDTQSGILLRRLEGHRGPIYDAAFTPDGRRAVTGAADRSMILWDIENDDLLLRVTGHSRSVRAVAFSPDKRTFLSASKDQTMILWDSETGAVLRTFKGHTDGLRGVTFSMDGKTALTSSSDKTLILWDVETGEALRTYTGHDGEVYKAAFSPDGKTFISGSADRTLILWDVETGAMLQRLKGHEDEVRDVAFDPNGETVLSGSLDGTVILWDLATGEIRHRFTGHTSEVLAVAYSPDGHTALSGSGDNTLILWDLETGALLRRYRGHSGAILGGIAFSPDGQLAISGSTDTTVILWDVETGDVLWRYRGHLELVNGVAFNPNGRTMISASSDRSVILWDVASFTNGSLDWVHANRYIEALTCDQRETYHIEPLCES